MKLLGSMTAVNIFKLNTCAVKKIKLIKLSLVECKTTMCTSHHTNI